MESYTQEVYSGMFSATTSVREWKNQDWEKVNYNGIVVNLQLIPWGNQGTGMAQITLYMFEFECDDLKQVFTKVYLSSAKFLKIINCLHL